MDIQSISEKSGEYGIGTGFFSREGCQAEHMYIFPEWCMVSHMVTFDFLNLGR